MAKTVLVLIVLVMFSIGFFIVSKVGVFLKESKKEASDEREGVQLVKILEGIPGERTKVNMNIQDSAWTKRQKNHHPIYIEKPSIKDYLLTFSIFVGCTVIGLVFQKLHFTDINIVTVYILGVLVTSIVTDGYLCGLVGSFLSVVLFCFFLTEPRMSFQTYAVGYPVTFLIMLISSVLTGTLAAKLKDHARLSEQQAFRTQILFDTDRLLQQAKNSEEILCVTCKQLVRLLNRDIVAYIVKNNDLSEGKMFFNNTNKRNGEYLTSEEQCVARWAYENGQRAGVTTTHFSSAKCLYLSIRSGESVYGVIGIPVKKDAMDSFEYSILLSVINECALAMENSQNAIEKEKNAILAKNEQLRADLLRAISHDLRTPLAGIMGTSEMIMDMSEQNEPRYELAQGIYKDADWLRGLVENILSLTRLQDGRLTLHKQMEPVEEVIGAALNVIAKRAPEREITVDIPDEIVMVPMDAGLIEQVLTNLLDNAIKHTQVQDEIIVAFRKDEQSGQAVFTVSDHGTGILDEDLPKIFEMFYTTKGSGPDARRGIGLGLAICESIIRAHGGTITASNQKKGTGAVFEFTLPLEESE